MDLTPGDKVVPPFSLGGPDDYAISPDSREVCFAMNGDLVPATSTNNDLYVDPDRWRSAQKVTATRVRTTRPLYSPDGNYLAYRSQARAGYESDKWRLMVLERSAEADNPTEAIDRSVENFIWSPDSKRLFFGVVDRGHQAIQFVAIEGGGARVALAGANTLDDMQFAPDGKTMVFTQQSGSAPVEICKATSSGGAAVAADASQRRSAEPVSAHAARRFLGRRRGERADSELRREAAGVQSRPEISGADADPRRSAGRVG